MKKVMKSKQGVSLIETVCVLAIIVVLASSFVFGAFKIFKHIEEVLVGDDSTPGITCVKN